MRITKLFAIPSMILAAGLSTAQAQTDQYFDVDGATPGSGVVDDVTNPTWDAATTNWSTDPTGSIATTGWTNGDNAIFSAGTDATGKLYAVTLAGAPTVNNATIEEGTLLLAAGQLANATTGQVLVKPNAAIRSIASSQFNTGGKLVLQGTSLTDAAHFQARNTGSAGSMITAGSGLKTVEIDGFGRLSYDDGDGIPDNKVSIIASNVFTGTGGTPDNGGAGMLVKSGPDQIGYAVKDTGGGVMNFSLNSFKYLRVEQGAFRLRNTASVIDERLFGAVPLAPLADAIQLDGGGIGSNLTVTLHANRGITIGPNGGYFDNGATAGLTIPSQLSGAGTLTIGSPTTTAVNNVTFTLSNANNINSFTGNLVGIRGVLALQSSLKVGGLIDGAGNPTGNPTNTATISITTGNTLSAGTNNGTDTWSTVISGAGGFTKVGTGQQTLAGVNTYSGDTKVDGGTLSISNAYLANAADVHVSTGGIFDLNFAGTDTIDQLFLNGIAQTPGIWGSAASGAANPSALFTGLGTLTVTTGAGPVGVQGDYDNNGVVDAADYVVWANGGPLQNEVTGVTPGSVTVEDYDAWRARLGNVTGSGSNQAGAVPEPTSIVLVFAAFIGLALTGRRSR